MLKQNLVYQRGFTLIELLVVVIIITTLAAIAYPSYQKYAIHNVEKRTQARMLALQIQLNRWRASALTYSNFVPEGGYGEVTSKDDDDNDITIVDGKTLYIPQGANESNYQYKITLVDRRTGSPSLVDGNVITTTSGGSTTKTIQPVAGRGWAMLATPNPESRFSTGSKIVLTSAGLRCMIASTNTNVTSTNIGTITSCGTGAEEW